jgi:hypothetical protein
VIAHYNLANAYYDNGQGEEAIKRYEIFIKHAHNQYDEYIGRAKIIVNELKSKQKMIFKA